MKKQLLFLMALFVSINCHSQNFVQNNITYQITSTTLNTVRVINYNTAGGSIVTIPATVTNNSIIYNVTAINQLAFNAKNLTQVVLPNSLTSIGLFAFASNQLTSITIPNSVTSIGQAAFEDNQLSSANIPTSLSLIESQVFRNNQLTSITIPNSITSIGQAAFGNNELTSVTIGNGVQSINSSAFVDNQISNLIIGNSVTTIGQNAFKNNQLINLTIPNSVTTISPNAFENNLLTNLNLGNNVQNIGQSCFMSNQIATLILPSSLLTIASGAFIFNPLTHVISLSTIPPTITTGSNDTFESNGIRSGIHLHIPAGTLGAYVTNAGALWTGFNPVTQDALGTSNFELENEVKIITTPNGIELFYSNNIRLENYEIYNLTGARIKKGKENNNIAIDEIANGIYILRLNFDKGTVVKKININ